MNSKLVIDIGKPTLDFFTGNLKILKFENGTFQMIAMQLNDEDEESDDNRLIVTIIEFSTEEMKAINDAITGALK